MKRSAPAACLILGLCLAGTASATEGGASVYPSGVETVMPGAMPAPGGSIFAEFQNFYTANETVGPTGHALVPGFHLRVSAVAVKMVHNWGVHVLGGTLVSTGALPLLDIHLSAPFGTYNKVGFGNPDIETLVAYKTGDLHWWYGFEVYTPGFAYNKTDVLNVGQHNYATAPSAAFSYLPHHGRTEISSKWQYIVNYKDNATQYRSGAESIWEFDAMQNVTKNIAVGGNGFYYQQATDDLVNGLPYLGGNRGRTVEFGPEIRCHFHHYAMILKYQKDFLTQNKTVGNSLWLEFGIPFGHPHQD